MSDITARITLGEFDTELERIQAVARERERYLAKVVSLELKIGDRVAVASNVRPKGLANLTGEIKSIRNGTRGSRTLSVQLDHPELIPYTAQRYVTNGVLSGPATLFDRL